MFFVSIELVLKQYYRCGGMSQRNILPKIRFSHSRATPENNTNAIGNSLYVRCITETREGFRASKTDTINLGRSKEGLGLGRLVVNLFLVNEIVSSATYIRHQYA